MKNQFHLLGTHMSSLSHMWKLHATAKMKEFWNCQVTTAKRVDLANAHQALQGQPSSHSRHAWFPSLQCAGRLPGTGLGTWDAANLPQCPSAQFSIPQTALWHAWTFLPHRAYCFFMQLRVTLAFPVAVTCKLAKYFRIIGTQHKAPHTTGPFIWHPSF